MGISIDKLRELCNNNAVKYTAHIVMRLQERGINPSDIRECIATGRIIEQYPSDYPYPSCLVLGCSVAGRMLHVVVGVGQGYIWLVTAYYPNPDEWSEGFSVRKERDK